MISLINRSIISVIIFLLFHAESAQLTVGPQKQYSSLQSALSAAQPSDEILVYPQADNAPYQQVALNVYKKKITFRGIGTAGQRVRLSGEGFNFSGAGAIPRAMFQFNLGADSCVVENFEITDCHNDTYNGAAFRINQANCITIRNCEFFHNDMGLMSNGSVSQNTASDQLIENCIVHDNGNDGSPGYNHNFYAGGTSITIRGCNIYSATTGHNVKSRAHLTIVEGCFVHDSPNREFDLVDETENTAAEGSHALISGCVIVKKENMSGNKTVIHFGQDGGGQHAGTVYVVNCTILTPYVSPVVDLSASGAGIAFFNCIVMDPSASHSSGQVLVSTRNGASISNTKGTHMLITPGFDLPSGGTWDNITETSFTSDIFTEEGNGDFRPGEHRTDIVDAGISLDQMQLPSPLDQEDLFEFTPPAAANVRNISGSPDLGAYEWQSSLTAGARIGKSMPVFGKSAAVNDLLGRSCKAFQTSSLILRRGELRSGKRILLIR